MSDVRADSSSEYSVSLQDVGKTFPNSVVALDGFNLDLRPGEFVSLLGASGCGKSTALRLIAGLAQPTRGTVQWHGASVGAGRAGDARENGQKQIGFVFQEPTLMPWTTVARNVSLPLELTRVEAQAAAARVAAALDLVGLSGFADAYPRELSGGMRMRVSIARALVTEPAFLLMDEPFAALDEITRFKLNDDLLTVWRALRKTVVFVTHSVFESVYLSERIVVMTRRPGRVFTELRIDAPYPRERDFRTSPEYAALCRQASEALAAATGGSA